MPTNYKEPSTERIFNARHCDTYSEHVIRGKSASQPYCYITKEALNNNVPPEYTSSQYGSYPTWGVEDTCDDVVAQAVRMARARGIPTLTGNRRWAQSWSHGTSHGAKAKPTSLPNFCWTRPNSVKSLLGRTINGFPSLKAGTPTGAKRT